MTDVLLLRGLPATDHLNSLSKFANFDLYSRLLAVLWLKNAWPPDQLPMPPRYA